MKTKLSMLAIAILTSGCSAIKQDSISSHHWSYTGDNGPEHWGILNENYKTCDTGANQSPINLTKFIKSNLSPLKLEYNLGGHEIINNGHTIQINYQSGSKLGINNNFYELKQFHFHSPSENHINNKSYPMEIHLVHADSEGNLAVVAVMFEEGDENKTLKEIWKKIPESKGIKNTLPSLISVNGLLPLKQEYYRFNGSLTTPPCSEGVLWLVMKQPITVSKEQINRFTHIMHHPTNRPIQPVNARPVLE